MNSHLMDWTEWFLIPAAVLVLAASHRLDLVVIVVPMALLAAYGLSENCAGRRPRRRKILE